MTNLEKNSSKRTHLSMINVPHAREKGIHSVFKCNRPISAFIMTSVVS